MVFSKLITMENLIPKFRLMYLSVCPRLLNAFVTYEKDKSGSNLTHYIFIAKRTMINMFSLGCLKKYENGFY